MELGNQLVTNHRHNPGGIALKDIEDKARMCRNTTWPLVLLTEWLNQNEDARSILAEMGFDWPVVKK